MTYIQGDYQVRFDSMPIPLNNLIITRHLLDLVTFLARLTRMAENEEKHQ
jgi:hypothetical protein